MRPLALAALVTGLTLAACASNAGDLVAFCAAATDAAEAAQDIDHSESPEDLRAAYEAVDVSIQEMTRTAPEEIASDMRAVDAAWDANIEALDDVDYVIEDREAPEDPDEGDEIEAATTAVESFISDECDVEFDTGSR